MCEKDLFTYPEGYEEMLKSLDFIPEEQRHVIMKLFFDFAGMGIIS